ncbi:MAG: hypothetical protein ACKOAY_09445 [Haliscomenobacter sp.]
MVRKVHSNSIDPTTALRYYLCTGFLCFILSIPFSAFAQELAGKNTLTLYHDQFSTGVHPVTGHFLVFTQSKYYELDDVSGTWSAHAYKKNQLDSTLLRPGNLLYVPTPNGSYYLQNGGGAVYAFRDSSLIRIDQSFPHRNQYGGAFFFHDEKIYLYGGYGFFQHKPYMTEFSLNNPQWYVYGYDPQTHIPAARNNMMYHLNADEQNLYIAEGRGNKHPAVNGSQSEYFRDVWVFNLPRRKWKKLGWISSSTYPRDHSDPLMIGNKSYFINLGQAKLLYAVDLKNNTISGYSATDNQNHRINGFIRPVYGSKLKKMLLTYSAPDDMTQHKATFILKATSLKELEHNIVFTQRLYYPKYWATLGILLLVAIFLTILILAGRRFMVQYWRLARHKPGQSPAFVLDTKSRMLFHQDRIVPFHDEHMDLILAFWQNGWGLTNLKLLEVVRAGQESQEALKKRKARVLDEVNQQFAYTTQSYEPFIIEVKDQNDRRYKEYLINPVYISSIHVLE